MKRARMSVCLRVCVRECEEEGARVGAYVCVCERAGYVFVCWKNSLEVK